MKTKAQVEIEIALGILISMNDTITRLEEYWPKYKRGSNAQRMLDSIKEKRLVAEGCLSEALANLGVA